MKIGKSESLRGPSHPTGTNHRNPSNQPGTTAHMGAAVPTLTRSSRGCRGKAAVDPNYDGHLKRVAVGFPQTCAILSARETMPLHGHRVVFAVWPVIPFLFVLHALAQQPSSHHRHSGRDHSERPASPSSPTTSASFLPLPRRHDIVQTARARREPLVSFGRLHHRQVEDREIFFRASYLPRHRGTDHAADAVGRLSARM